MVFYDLLREVLSDRSQWRLSIPVMLAGMILYGTLVAAAILHAWRHYEWLAIFLQVALLLPSLLYGLSGSKQLESPSLPFPLRPRFWTAIAISAFLIASAALSAVNVQGISISDETAYRFQARILGTGRLEAAAPPGAPEQPRDAPLALRFNHTILSRNGWFGKYPIGWPLVLALPEKLGLGWLVNPVLAVGILICTAKIARALSDEVLTFWAVMLLVFSPCFLAPSAMLLSHEMAGLLVAAACWAWMEGMRQRKLPYFAVMYLLTGLTFHVRPFTALLTAATLTGCLACSLRRARGLLIRVLATGAVLGIATVGSLLLYNKAFTGSIWLSPYALLKGVSIPLEISASLPEAVHNINVMWRFGGQSTVVYFFPLIFFLAGLGFWKNRSTSPVVWLLLSLFVVTVLGHLVQTESSGSVVAERYWFEAYFAIAILGAQGIVAVTTALQSSHRPLIAATCTLLAIQTIITFCAIKIILRRSAPFIAVAHLAAQYENCLCVVFLKSSPPVFFGQHMNLNGPDWPRAKVFYAIDPGPELRMSWTRTLGRDRFVVVSYDQVRGEAEQNE